MDPVFFDSPEAFRNWLAEHHATETEVLVGFHKKATGRAVLTWSDAVDQALCFGWIDGVRRSAGPDAYSIRFTPRKARSIWSAVNIAKMERLLAAGRVAPAGRAAFEARTEDRSRVYSFEQREEPALPAEYEQLLRADAAAWQFFSAQPPYYRRTATFWVISAKKEDTRRRRLATLIEDSAAGRRIGPLSRPSR